MGDMPDKSATVRCAKCGDVMITLDAGVTLAQPTLPGAATIKQVSCKCGIRTVAFSGRVTGGRGDL